MKDNQQQVFEEILLPPGPPPVRIQHARIAIEHIEFDEANPRLRYLKEQNPDKATMQLLFESTPDTAWLKKDIKSKGVIDPIYVQPLSSTGLASGTVKFKVIEGNRRLACVKELHADEPEAVMFFTIPARVLPESVTEVQTALLMASFHVAGKVKWDAHEKAGHVYQMLKVLHIPEAELSTTLHMAVPTIKRTAESFAILEETYKKIDGGKYADTAARKWSFFHEMLRSKPLRELYTRDPADWSAKFSRWVGEGRLTKSEQVRKLPEILTKAKARFLFENEPAAEAFDKAEREADTSNPKNVSKLFKQLDKVLEVCKAAPFADIELAAENDAARVLLTDAYQAIGSFMERAGVRVPGPRRVA